MIFRIIFLCQSNIIALVLNQNIIILAKQINQQHQMILIILSLLCWSMTCLEYHLDRQFILCCMKDIAAITPLLNGGIAVEAANPSVTILNGTGFSTKVAEIKADSSVSKIIVAPDGGVYFGDGRTIIRKAKNPTNVTFQESVLWSNMVLTDKYALVGQKDSVPILKKLDLQKLKVETYILQPAEKWFDYHICLSDLKNGQIIFGERYTVYLLNNETLNVEQTFVETEPYTGTDFDSMGSFWTPQESVILIRGGSYKYETYRSHQDSKLFEFFNRFYSATTLLTLTSPTAAVSTYKGKLLYWKDFDSQVLARSWDFSEYIGVCKTPTLSNSEVFFATFQQSLSIRFITLTPDNNISIISTVRKSDGQVSSAKFTDDDAYLIYQNENYDQNRLCKLDMISKQETILMDGKQPLSVLAFLLMGNKFIVFMNRTTEDSIHYYVQLREIATFSLISQLEVKLNLTTYNFKLLGNKYWNSNFILIIQTQKYTAESLAFKFRVVEDQFQLILSEMQYLAFKNSFACNKYLIYIPGYENKNPRRYENIQVYDSQTMSLIKTISNGFEYNTFFSAGDILMAQYSQGTGTFIFDFSRGIDNFEKGLFFRQYYNYNGASYRYTRVLFPKRSLYLLSNAGVSGTNYPTKLIYDLKKIPVIKLAALPVSLITASVVMRSPSNSQCLWVFIASQTQKKLVKYDDGDVSNPQIVSDMPIKNPIIFLSKNQKYLLLSYEGYNRYEYYIEVRLASNIKVLVKKLQLFGFRQTLESIDITKDQKIIIHLNNHLLVFDMELQQSYTNLGIKSIDIFDVSQNMIAIVGKSSSDANTYLLVVKRFNELQSLVSFSLNILPKIVKLSQSGTRVAVYDSGSKLSVWDVNGQMLITGQVFEGVLDMRFINDAKVLLQFFSNFSIIPLDNFQKVRNNRVSLNFTKIAANSDGSLVAALVNPTNAKVFDNQMKEIANFIPPPNNNIVDVDFSPTDELYAVTSNGTLFILSPGPCPATFVNVESVCACPQNRTNTAGSCLCSPNYVEKDNECLCINGFTFDGRNCFCNSNATVANGACNCKPNFIRQGDACLCANGFTFDGDKCLCNANATVAGSMCTCRETFLLIDNTCVCPNDQTYANGQCLQCSSMCSVCDGSGTFDCSQYSAVFYIAVAGVCVLGVALIVIIFCVVKRRREKASILQTNLSDNKDNESKSQSSLNEQLYDGKYKK